MKSLIAFIKKIFSSKYMIKKLVIRDLTARYAGSGLGVFWSILHPISLIATYYFVFSFIMGANVGPEFGDVNFTAWLVGGLLPWLFFADVVGRSNSIIIDNTNLITKTTFSSEILPFVSVISGLINHYITLILFILIGCIFNIINPSFNLILLLPYSLVLMIFAMGFSWLLSAVNVYLRDVQQLTGIIINLWFYFSPILYPVSQVPEAVAFILKLNPIYHIVYGYRAIIFNDLSVISTWGLIYVCIVAICIFGFGGYIFKKLKSGFSDIL